MEEHSDSDSDSGLQEQIHLHRQKLSDDTLSVCERLAYSINLANLLCDNFDLGGSDDVLREASELAEIALSLAPEGSPEHLTVLSDLSTIALTKYEHFGNDKDLEIALDLISAAVNTRQPNSEASFHRLINFGNTLRTVYERFGNTADLERALEVFRDALKPESTESDLRAKGMSNMACALHLRYERNEIFSDLEETISMATTAYNTAEDIETAALCMLNLSGYMTTAAERVLDDAVVQTALEIANQAIAFFSDDNPSKGMCHHNISYLYRLRYERVDGDGNHVDLEAAIVHAEQAIANPSIGQIQKSIFQDQLGVVLEQKYKLSGSQDVATLNRAIDLIDAALKDERPLNPSLAPYANHLADLLVERSKFSASTDDQDRALALYQEVLNMDAVVPLIRIAAGHSSALILAQCEQWQLASNCAEKAVRLIPKLARNALHRKDQQYLLSQLTGVSQLAASLALNSGKSASAAFEIVELGRAVIVGFSIASLDQDNSTVEDGNPASQLVNEYNNLREALAGWTRRTFSEIISSSTNILISRQHKLIKELEDLEVRIQQIPGHESFQRSFSAEKLQELLGGDFIVSFNVTKFRSDAFIISRSSIDCVPLPGLTFIELGLKLKDIAGPDKATAGRFSTSLHRNQRMSRLLSWLWAVAVKPIFSQLGILLESPPSTTETLPTVYWVTIGAMGLMPLHAAGYHDPRSTEYAMRYAISSYALSTKVLAFGLQAGLASSPTAIHSTETTLAFISMPTTPGQVDLDFKLEKTAFMQHMPQPIDIPYPSCKAACEALSNVYSVHFACHAKADASDPSESRLLLGVEHSQIVDPLTVGQIARLDISRAQLAYLSACETAEIQRLDLIDEVIHLVGAFQAAGFTHVIGTFWEADDDVAGEVANVFYRKLGSVLGYERNDRTRVPQIGAGYKIAEALHEAVLQARQDAIDTPLGWASFVHFGP